MPEQPDHDLVGVETKTPQSKKVNTIAPKSFTVWILTCFLLGFFLTALISGR